MVAQQVKARNVAGRKAVLNLLDKPVALGHDLPLQGREVGVCFTVEDHHIHGESAKGPPWLRAQQGLYQGQAFASVDAHQQDGFVARDAKPPQLPLVYGPAAGAGTRTGVHEQRGKILQCRGFINVNSEVAQAYLGQRGGHSGGTLNMHRLQVLVDTTSQLLFVGPGCSCKAQPGHPTGRNTYRDAQAGNGVKAVNGRRVVQPGLGVKSGLVALVVAPQKAAPVGRAVHCGDLGVGFCQEVGCARCAVTVQAGSARHQQGTPCGVPFGLYKQV